MAVIGGIHSPFGLVPHEIPQKIVKGGRIHQRDIDVAKKRPNSYFDLLGFGTKLNEAIYISGTPLAHVFFHLPTVIRESSLFEAAHLYEQATGEFEFVTDDIDEALAEPEAEPEAAADRVALESATLNHFRSIEAIVGEPGKEELFRRRLLDVGIDPDEHVGFEPDRKKKISERIRWLQELRDDTSGHGRRRRSAPLKFREVMEAQYLARVVVTKALIHHTSSIGRIDGGSAERLFLLEQMYGKEAIEQLCRKLHKIPPHALVARPGGFEQVIRTLSVQKSRRRDENVLRCDSVSG